MKDFYPTPKELAMKMYSKVDLLSVKSVLEPSAGKGDLLEPIKEAYDIQLEAKLNSRRGMGGYYNHNITPNFDIDCVEIETVLRPVLTEKGYRVVGDDFLQYRTFKKYDLLIANFPFSDGASHLLHAIWLMGENGGQIVCLLNAETIRNPYTSERKVLQRKLEDLNAEIEYLTGQFSNAEHPTEVEVALIYVQVPEKEGASLILDTLERYMPERETEEDFSSSELADADLITAAVQQYEREIRMGVNLIREYRHLQKAAYHSADENCIGYDFALTLNLDKREATISDYCMSVRKKYYKMLFSHPFFTKHMTEDIYKEFQSKINEMAEYEFSRYNIMQLYNQLCSMLSGSIERTIIELFEKFSHQSAYYEGSSNIHYYNGWKTNSAYKVNKKVIIQLNAFEDSFYAKNKEFNPTSYYVSSKLQDMEKAMAYLEGGQTDGIDMVNTLSSAKSVGITSKINTKYFTLTFYKKGTCHIEFKDEGLLKKFNLYGSMKKGWLPHDYGKKAYRDMTQEEKDVVDAFEGEESYASTCAASEYFLPADNNMLMLAVS